MALPNFVDFGQGCVGNAIRPKMGMAVGICKRQLIYKTKRPAKPVFGIYSIAKTDQAP
jgi:hypothetical protein